MPSTIYALVDCNNFFVSCERVFDPALRKRPVIVLSNNDGCTVARSNEAKQLGIAMGAPYFKIKGLVQRYNVAALSSNFALYGNMSARVMSIMQALIEHVEIYSIDEAFLNLSALQDYKLIEQTCRDLSNKIEQYTGIPVSIGIAPTRTLAKIANHIAKKHATQRVFVLQDHATIQNTLATFNIRDIWGIGRKYEQKLQQLGINTAAELARLSAITVKRIFNINMWRIVQELNSIACITLLDNHANKKQIMVSRSFGRRVTDIWELQEALATYTSAAATKLRAQQSIAAGIYVFLHTGLHGAPEQTYKNALYIPLPIPTSNTINLIYYAKQGLKNLFQPGYRYQKVGIILCDLRDVGSQQFDIFADSNLQQQEKLMTAVDQINHKLGKFSIQFAAAGLAKPWQMQCKNKSNAFTSSWHGLPLVKL